jgi:urease accessory protein UreE
VILIDQVPSNVTAEELAGKERDTLRLTWEGRRWTRRKLTTSGGREVALALPTGTTLHVGAVLHVDSGFYLAVEGEPEPVVAVRPRDPSESLRVAFEVGNRHFSLAQEGDALLVPDDVGGPLSLLRFYALHVVIVPLLMFVLTMLHFFVIRRQKGLLPYL